MANDADSVFVGASGKICFAPLGTVLPVDATTPIPVAWLELGNLGMDGLGETPSSDVTEIPSWAMAGAIVRSVQTKFGLDYTFVMQETNANAVLAYYGNGDESAWTINAKTLPRRPWLFEINDGDKVLRICVPDGQITKRDTVKYENGKASERSVTLSCFPDSSGENAYCYTDDGVV